MSKVIEGKDGYLFLAGKDNAVINQHTGERSLNEWQLHKWKRVISSRNNYLKQNGIDYYLQIVPDKHPVYKQYLPDEVQLSENRNIDTFLNCVGTVIRDKINYPLDEILSASKPQQVYFKRDSHWTDRGAYIAYLDLMSLIKQDYPDISILNNLVYKPGTITGDLARMTGDDGEPAEIFKVPPTVKKLFDNNVENTGHIMIFNNPNAENNLKLMIFGSSSTLNSVKFFNRDFKTIIFYWSGNFDYSAINHFRPDILINQIRERHLIRPADDTVGFTTTEMAFVKSYYKIGDDVSPISFNQSSTLSNCLAKIGNKSNQTYEKHLKKLCEKIGISTVYDFALNINRKKYSFRKIRILVFSKLLVNQIFYGGIKSRLNQLIAHYD